MKEFSLCPVIISQKAASALGWVVKEMESRYRLMTKEGVRNIDGYNSKHKLPMLTLLFCR